MIALRPENPHIVQSDRTLLLEVAHPAFETVRDELARFAPNAIAAVKRLARDAVTLPLAEHLDRERDAFIASVNHANGAEGLAAWRERRAPDFR